LDYGKIHAPKVVMKATKSTIQITHYFVLSCDEVFTIDSQFKLFIHYYAVNNWVNIFLSHIFGLGGCGTKE